MSPEIIQYIISAFAIILSLISLVYSYRQNKRRIEVDIDVVLTNQHVIQLSVFNSGYRSVAVIKSDFCVNGKPLNLKEGYHNNNSFWISQTKRIDFPYGLKEGHVLCYTFSARQFAVYLENEGYSGVVKLSGYFKNAQKNRVMSKNCIDFDIEKYKKVQEIDNSPNIHIKESPFGKLARSY
jgi:hypothetical protein